MAGSLTENEIGKSKRKMDVRKLFFTTCWLFFSSALQVFFLLQNIHFLRERRVAGIPCAVCRYTGIGYTSTVINILPRFSFLSKHKRLNVWFKGIVELKRVLTPQIDYQWICRPKSPGTNCGSRQMALLIWLLAFRVMAVDY